MMDSLRILLGDPRHDAVLVHNNIVPLGIGYIGSYLIEKLKN